MSLEQSRFDRQVIEILLCTADSESPTMDEMADGDETWFDLDAVIDAQDQSDAVLLFDMFIDDDETYDDAALEAAYRLIESSPTLIREWFGGGK